MTKIVKEVKKKGKRLDFPSKDMPDDLLALAVECQNADPEARPMMTDVSTRITAIRRNPVITVKVVTQEEMGSEAKFGYKVRLGKTIPLLESAQVDATETGKSVSSQDGILYVTSQINVGKAVQGVHDQIFLKIGDAFITVLDPATADLLIEECDGAAPVGPKRRVDDAKESGFDSLLRVMRTHIACKEVCKLASKDLCNMLLAKPDLSAQLSSLGAPEALCLVATVWQEDVALLQNALRGLVNLATPQTHHGAAMPAAGIIPIISKALQLSESCRDTAILMMMNMSMHPGNVPHLRPLLADVIEILKTGDGPGTSAMPAWNLFQNVLMDAESQKLLLDAGLAEAVVAAFDKHADDPRYIQPLMAIVFHTAGNPVAEDLFVAVSGRAMEALKQHISVDGVLQNGLLAVTRLTANPKNLPAMVDAEICETSFQLLKRAVDDVDRSAIRELGKDRILPTVNNLLSTSDAATEQLADAGILELIERLLTSAAAEKRKDYLRSALLSAFHLSSKPGGPQLLATASFCGAVAKVLDAMPLEEGKGTVEPALFVIINTLQGASDSARIFGDAGACEAVVVVLANNLSNSHLVEVSILAICLLSAVKTNKDRLAAVNTRSTIQMAADKHPGEGKLQHNAKIALASF